LNGYARSSDETYVPPGWDEWYAEIGGHGYYDYRLNENGKVVSYGSAEEDYHTDVLADKAKAYVRSVAGGSEPFFLYLAPATPHGPFIPAPRHEDEYPDAEVPRSPSFDEPDMGDKPAWMRDLPQLSSAGESTDAGEKPTDAEEEFAVAEETPNVTEKAIDDAYRNRLRMLLSLDEMVADLIEELRAAGELENTYVLFTSDNGYHLGEHRLNIGKRTAYEEDVKVPIVMRGPRVSAGRTAEQIALNIDVAPTVAELAGVSAPAFVDGRSLVPLLEGAPPAFWRSAFLLEHWSGGRAHHRLAPNYAAIRTETHKYVEHNSGDEELYDLSSDPHEQESLHASVDTELIESLKSRLEALKACAGQSCREAEDAP
jgi:arylsulfatase A-like enzyme